MDHLMHLSKNQTAKGCVWCYKTIKIYILFPIYLPTQNDIPLFDTSAV